MIFSYFYDVVCCTYCFLEGADRERLQLSLACEQALLLGESREVTRELHAKGDASASRSRVLSRLTSLATRNRELARAQANFLRFRRQRSRLVSASDSHFPKPTTKACFLR